MSLHEMIRHRRKELELTQEQVAQRLGVSSSAVHKWEVGASCPDIALLPPLARLLGVDLNALFSFHEDLTDREIALFLNELSKTMEREGYEEGFRVAMEKLREYPTSGLLASSTAMFLNGALVAFPPKDVADYPAAIEELYARAAESDCAAAREQASVMLIFRYADRGQWDRAETLLERFPKTPAFDRETIQISLLLRKKEYDQTAELIEHALLKHITQLNILFPQLLTTMLETGREEDAAYVAELAQRLAENIGLTGCVALSGPLTLAIHRRDADACLALLDKTIGDLLRGAADPGGFYRSPLFRHLRAKNEAAAAERGEEGKAETDNQRLLTVLLSSLQTDEQLAFLRSHPGYEKLLEKYGDA